jgi:hypothetical protein
MTYRDQENQEGREVEPHVMAHYFQRAVSTRGPEGDPQRLVKDFLFWNFTSIHAHLIKDKDL